MATSFGARTPPWSGGLQCAPFALNMHLHDHRDFLDAEHLNSMAWSSDVKTDYNTRNELDRDVVLGAWVRRCAHRVDRAQSCEATTFDILACRLYVEDNNTGMWCGLLLVLVSATHYHVKIFGMLVCVMTAGFNLITRFISLVISDTGPNE